MGAAALSSPSPPAASVTLVGSYKLITCSSPLSFLLPPPLFFGHGKESYRRAP